MQMREYLTKYDSLASEDALFDIPIRKEYLLSKIGRGKKVLDVGCLGGKMSRLIMDQNNEVWGVEVNPVAAEAARKRGVKVQLANVEDGLPFDDESFDVVNAGEILEHLYDTKSFFEEARRVLKPGGLLIFTTTNLNSLENRIRVASGGYLSMAGAYPEDHFGAHVRVFNLPKIRELCFDTNFEVKDVAGVTIMDSHGKWIDVPMGLVGKLLPSFSKILLITAQKQ
jgi:2-polyprenyl-3-methyl-5-hydroxy-6-metoxy-1,4-benzoquinol methylase